MLNLSIKLKNYGKLNLVWKSIAYTEVSGNYYKMRIAFLLGITGQGGTYATNLLLEKKYGKL